MPVYKAIFFSSNGGNDVAKAFAATASRLPGAADNGLLPTPRPLMTNPAAQIFESLGIIAGNRSLPLLFAKEARRMGVKHLVAVAFHNETDPSIANLVDEVVWIRVGQLSKLIDGFIDNGIKNCVMLGQIAPKNLFEVRPDIRGLALLLRLKVKNAHTVFGAIADELKSEGVELIEPTPWLQPWMAVPGFHLGPKLSSEQKSDIEFGYRLAKEVSRLEIGQTVVVKEGTILAVEGFEGTDRCLARGGELAGKGGGAVAVKVAKAKHDMRFDIPCVGPQTIQTCANSGVHVLAVEADKTIVLEMETVKELTAKYSIALTSTGSP